MSYIRHMDYTKIDNVEVDGIDYNDYPDFCDAYIVSADYDGSEMSEDELELLNEDRDFVYGSVLKHFFG